MSKIKLNINGGKKVQLNGKIVPQNKLEFASGKNEINIRQSKAVDSKLMRILFFLFLGAGKIYDSTDRKRCSRAIIRFTGTKSKETFIDAKLCSHKDLKSTHNYDIKAYSDNLTLVDNNSVYINIEQSTLEIVLASIFIVVFFAALAMGGYQLYKIIM